MVNLAQHTFPFNLPTCITIFFICNKSQFSRAATNANHFAGHASLQGLNKDIVFIVDLVVNKLVNYFYMFCCKNEHRSHVFLIITICVYIIQMSQILLRIDSYYSDLMEFKTPRR